MHTKTQCFLNFSIRQFSESSVSVDNKQFTWTVSFFFFLSFCLFFVLFCCFFSAAERLALVYDVSLFLAVILSPFSTCNLRHDLIGLNGYADPLQTCGTFQSVSFSERQLQLLWRLLYGLAVVAVTCEQAFSWSESLDWWVLLKSLHQVASVLHVCGYTPECGVVFISRFSHTAMQMCHMYFKTFRKRGGFWLSFFFTDSFYLALTFSALSKPQIEPWC